MKGMRYVKFSKLVMGFSALMGLAVFSVNYLPFLSTKATSSTYYIDIATTPASGFLTMANMAPGDSVSSILNVENKGNVDFTYSVSSRLENGDTNLYKTINLQVTDRTGKLYEGPMADFQRYPLGTLASFQERSLTFMAQLPANIDNSLQGKSVNVAFDFTAVGQTVLGDDCFLQPFSNQNFTLHQGSDVPIKFHLHDDQPHSNVRLEITGPSSSNGQIAYVFSLDNGKLDLTGNHYLAQFSTRDYAVVTNGTYKATIYVDNVAICEKEFMVLEQGNRSNSPHTE